MFNSKLTVYLSSLLIILTFSNLHSQGTGSVNGEFSPYILGFTKDLPEFEAGQNVFNESINPGFDPFSGAISFEIPLFELQGKYLKIPIGISYNSSAIKVEMYASTVGTGWNLNVGASITREIRDNTDLIPKYSQNPNYNSYLTGNYPIGGECLDWNATRQNGESWDHNNLADELVWQDELDLEPDLFHVNIPGYSFDFYFKYDENSYQFKPEILTRHDIDIEFPMSETGQWIITLPNGIKYYFSGSYEWSIMRLADAYHTNGVEGLKQEVVSAWYVTKIEHPTGESINFEYTQYEILLPSPSLKQTKYYNSCENRWNSITNFSFDGLVSKEVIDKITWDNGQKRKEIIFEFADDRLDFSDEKRLKSISYQLTNLITQNTVEIKKYELIQSNLNNRLWLDELIEKAPDSSGGYLQKPPYVFNYKSKTAFPDSNPSRTRTDFWGYYNGQNSGWTTTRQPESAPSFPTGFYSDFHYVGSVRTPSNHSTYGLLEEISFPVGGSLSFEYEKHEFANATAYGLTNGGGARVSSITQKDQDGITGLIKTMDYTTENGESTGKLHSIPFFKYNHSMFGGDCLDPNWSPYVLINTTNYSAEPIIPLKMIKNSYVGYNEVKINYGSMTDNTKYGYEVYKYHNDFNYVNEQFKWFQYHYTLSGNYKILVGSYYSIENKTGQLKSKVKFENYDNSFIRKTEEIVYYSSYVNSIINGRNFSILTVPLTYADINSGFSIVYLGYNEPQFDVCQVINSNYYFNEVSLYRPDRKTFIKYDDFGNSQTNYENYRYNQESIKRTHTANSLGQFVGYETLRGGPAFLPIHKSFENNGLVSESKYEYNEVGFLTAEYTGKSEHLIADEEDLDTNYRLKRRFEYDEGNYLEKIILPKGRIVSYLNDPMYFGPVCEVINCLPEEIAYTGFETKDMGNLIISDLSAIQDQTTSQPAKTGNRYYNLSSRMINYTRTEPVDGGYSILSFWSTAPTSIGINTGMNIISETITLADKQGWSLVKLIIGGSGSITITGNGFIDEVRYYPEDAFMKSISYDIQDRVISDMDVRDESINYNYDEFGRVKVLTDANKDVLETTDYNYGN